MTVHLENSNNNGEATAGSSTSYTINSYTSNEGTSGAVKSLNEIVDRFLCQQSMETASKIAEDSTYKDPKSIIDLKNSLIDNGLCLNILVKDLNPEIADLALAKLIEIYKDYRYSNNSNYPWPITYPQYPIYKPIDPYTPIDPYFGVPTCATGNATTPEMQQNTVGINFSTQDTVEKKKPGRPKKTTTI